METVTLVKKIDLLSEDQKLKLEGYIDALLSIENQHIALAEPGATYKNSRAPKPVFGSGKGTFGKMADDFDEPLDDMNEYM